MTELELSVMAHSATTAEDLRPILARFEAEHRVHIKLRVFNWENGWTEVVKFALYGHGPDVSEIGSTWAGTLAATNTVRPFGVREMAAVGGRFAFLHPSWQSGYLAGEPEMWAMPWLGNVRFVFYRRDQLQRAGVDETAAFRTPDRFAAALAALSAAGVAAPLVIPTADTVDTLHTAAMWVWGAGGNFISNDGRHTRFDSPEARAGLQAYFDLHRYLAPAARRLNSDESDAMFLRGEAAVTISDPGLLYALTAGDRAAPGLIEQMQTALPPGVPFVGGSNLVVWRHSRQHKLAVELVKYLTSQTVQVAYSQKASSLPVRLDALTGAPFGTDALYRPIVEGLKTGRSYQVSRLWGLIEEKLVAELNDIWATIFDQPEPDVAAVLARRLPALAERLDLILSSDAR